MPQLVATELKQIGATHLAAKKDHRSTAGIFTHVLLPLLGTATAAKDLDSKYYHTPGVEICPVKSALLSFGPVVA